MHRSFSKYSLLAFAVLLISVLLALYIAGRPRIAPGQAPLKDIQDIGTLRSQFNKDVGQPRLIILVSPT